MSTVNVTEATFEAEVLRSELPVLIDLWAEWCGPCKQMAPAFDELSTELEGKVKFVKIDVDRNPRLAQAFRAQSIPMLVVVEFVLSGLTPSVSWVPGLAQLRDVAATRWAVQGIGATVVGDSHAWLAAVGALCALIVLALAGTYVAVRRSLRLPTAHKHRRSVTSMVRVAIRSLNPEMLRLSRSGAAGLAAVALVVSGARALVPAFESAPPPILAAHAAPTGGGDSRPLHVGDVATALPGLMSDMWWLWDAGTRFGIDVTEAAYLVSSRS